MIIDSLVSFVPYNVPLSLVGGAGVAIPSNVIDLLGSGVGTPPQNIIGNRTLFGSDAGIGGIRPQLEVLVTTAFTTGNSATLNIQFQAAVDTGAGGGNQPGTWNTLSETGPIAVANLGLGAVLARWDFFASLPVNLQPRYLRLNFAPAAATNFTAGAVVAPVVLVRDDQANKFTPANYAVA